MNPNNVKPTFRDLSSRLATIGVLIADDDRRISIIIRKVLESLGFKNIFLANDGSKALDIIKTQRIDMLITDWHMSPMDGISLVKYLRRSDDSPNRFLPIIMLTGNVEREHVETARDNGITEFVIKPFSAKTLCDRITLLIDSPRGFVINKNFVGPDRRRRSILPPDEIEKRRK